MGKRLLIESPGKTKKLSQIWAWRDSRASMGRVPVELASDGVDSLGFGLKATLFIAAMRCEAIAARKRFSSYSPRSSDSVFRY